MPTMSGKNCRSGAFSSLSWPMWILCVSAVTFLPGCYRQFVSIADLPQNTAGSGKLLVPGLGVIIRASNETSRSFLQVPSTFEMSFWFNPAHPGFRFDPKKVRLVFADGDVVVPGGVVTISDASDPSRVHTWKCWSNRRLPIEGSPPYALRSGYCFELYFNAPPPPADAPFTVYLDGLTREGRAVDVPPIGFKEGSFWVWDFLG